MSHDENSQVSAAEQPTGDDQWIFNLAADHEARGNGLYGPVTFSATGLVKFVKDVAAHLAGQSQATRAVPDLHNAIMNLPCNPPDGWGGIQQTGYKIGHRDARHAAAELVNESEAAQEVTQQAAPVRQPKTVSDERKAFDAYWNSLDGAGATDAEIEMCEFAAWQAWQARPRHCAALPLKASTPEPTTQQAAKAETAEQAKPVAWMRDNMRECKTDADVKQMASLEFGCWKEIAALYTIPLYLAPTTSTVSAPEEREIEWGHDLQSRLIAASQDIAENDEARNIMAEAACLLAALTGRTTSGKGEAA